MTWLDPRRLLNPAFWRYIREEYFSDPTARYQRINDAIEDRARRQAARCDICSGRDVYRCPICKAKVSHSHENDYICATHSFVSPIRDSDGARISGDGSVHPPRVIHPKGHYAS